MRSLPSLPFLLSVTTYTGMTTFLLLQLPHRSISYVTSGLPGHKHRAWLKKMTTDICQLPPGELSPEECVTTPLLVSAWAQNPWLPHNSKTPARYITTSQVYPHHGKECALACEQLLKRLVDERRAGNKNAIANAQTYNALIDVWSKSGEKGAAAQRAEQIVIGMQDAYASGEIEVQPDLESFRLVLRAWSQAKGAEVNASLRAQQILEWMIRLYESKANDLVQPDAECFDIVLHAWALSQHSESPRRIEELIMYMDKLSQNGNEKARPTRFSFNQVLTAWSKVKGAEAAQRAEDILYNMREIGRTTNADLMPNIVSYSAVVSAWCKSQHHDCGKRAEKILKLAEKQSKSFSSSTGTSAGGTSSNDVMRLDNVIYNLVIDAHAKTSSNKAHVRARAVLDRLIEQYNKGSKRCRPDVYSFSSVLSSCSNLSGSKKERQQAFDIAISTFEDMKRFGVQPNHVSYGIMLKACARLIPTGNERRKHVREIFKGACRDGCVGRMVLDRLKDASSKVQYEALLREHKENDLPTQWTSKVPSNEKYKRGSGRPKRRTATV